MNHQVRLTRSATRDLQGIYDYYLTHAGDGPANQLLDTLRASVANLASFPERGVVPKEIQETGLRQYRQVLCGHFRIIYRCSGDSVFVLMIIDARRDVRSALLRRQLM